MKPYKRKKLGMLMIVAMMSVSGTVFASEPQVISSQNSMDKVSIISTERNPSLKMKKDDSSLRRFDKKGHKKNRS